MFTKIAINKLQILVQKSVKISNDTELCWCLKELINALEFSSFERVVEYYEYQKEQSNKYLLELGQMVDYEYDEWKNEIKTISKNPVALQCLDFGDAQQSLERNAFPYYRAVGLRFAMRCILNNETQWEKTDYSIEHCLALLDGDRSAWVPDSWDDVIVEALETPTVVAWKKEHEFYQKISATLKDILYINQHRMGLGRADVKRMTIAVQSVCSYLMLTVHQLMNLEFLPIERIAYSLQVHVDGNTMKENSILTLQINDSNPIYFEDGRAEKLYQLCLNPKKYRVFSEDPKKNENIRKDFNAMNELFCEHYYQYGFVYGYNKLIHSDKYRHWLNLEFADVIKPMK